MIETVTGDTDIVPALVLWVDLGNFRSPDLDHLQEIEGGMIILHLLTISDRKVISRQRRSGIEWDIE